MTDVFVVGALHLDVVVGAARLPELDETLMGQGVAYRFGGKGGNQALAAARMGARAAMAGRVGADDFAATILAALAEAGVDHAQVRRVAGASGVSVAIVAGSGEYGAVVVSGVNQTIDAAEVTLGAAAVLLLQNEIPEAVNRAVAQTKNPGTRVILNAAPARPCSADLLDLVDLLVVNRVEARQMLGSRARGDDPKALAHALMDLGPGAVIVTAGKDGAYLVDGSGGHRIDPPVQAQGSAHGAGDAFVGALAAEIARGQDLKAAAAFAALSAAHFVQVPPADRAQITRRAVEAWRRTV